MWSTLLSGKAQRRIFSLKKSNYVGTSYEAKTDVR
jgi:hypothetical protein